MKVDLQASSLGLDFLFTQINVIGLTALAELPNLFLQLGLHFGVLMIPRPGLVFK